MGRIIPYIMENKKCLKPPTSSGRPQPQSTVKLTKNEGAGNHPERVWGIAQVLALKNTIN
jgi:hypothetical protein